MNIVRDRFLTEVIGECWHENELASDPDDGYPYWRCRYCHKENIRKIDFSSWEGFGKLVVWCKNQSCWCDIVEVLDVSDWNFNWLNPDRFADILYSLLKENQ